MNGLHFGTPETAKTGMQTSDIPALASLIADSLLDKREAKEIAKEVSILKQQFQGLYFINA